MFISFWESTQFPWDFKFKQNCIQVLAIDTMVYLFKVNDNLMNINVIFLKFFQYLFDWEYLVNRSFFTLKFTLIFANNMWEGLSLLSIIFNNTTTISFSKVCIFLRFCIKQNIRIHSMSFVTTNCLESCGERVVCKSLYGQRWHYFALGLKGAGHCFFIEWYQMEGLN